MSRKRALLALVVSIVVAGSASAATPARPMGLRPSSMNVIAARQVTRSDSSMTAIQRLHEQFVRGFRLFLGLGVVDLDLPTDGSDYRLDGVTDGSDGIDPLGAGAKDNGIHQNGPPPVTSGARIR